MREYHSKECCSYPKYFVTNIIWRWSSENAYLHWHTVVNCHTPLSYRVRSQGDSPPTAGTELGLAVRTQVPAAICELGLVADAACWRVVPVNGRACSHRGLPDHRLPVAGQLLLDTSGRNKTGTETLMIWKLIVFILWQPFIVVQNVNQ